MDRDLLSRAKINLDKISTSIKQSILEGHKPEDNLVKIREIAEMTIKEIVESIKLNAEEIRKLEEKVKSLEEEIRIMQRGKIVQEKQIASLKEKLDEHEMKFQNLEIGQIPFEFENNLALYIYPHHKKYTPRKIFTNMKKWLEEENDTPEGKAANRKWNELKNTFSWSSEHEKILFKLLKFRRPFAHPTVDRENVLSRLPNDFTDKEKELIKDIVNMTDRVDELMS